MTNLKQNGRYSLAALDAVARRAFAQRAGVMYQGERDLNVVLGYKKELTYKDFLYKYERQDVASRIVDMPVEATWRNPPQVFDGDSEDETAFQKDLQAIRKRARIFRAMQKADRLAGIGRYSVILIGLKGEENARLEEPATPVSGEKDVLYFKAYGEDRAKISRLDGDPESPRFGLPAQYRIDVVAEGSDFIVDSGTKTVTVHWSRVIHVAEDTLEDEIYGRPRLKRTYDRLDDVLKVAGGSAEIFWQTAAQLIHIDIDTDAEVEPEDMEALDKKLQEITHNIRRSLQTQGATVQTLGGSSSVDPTGAFQVLQLLLSSASGIPNRILFGSERGELASSEDAEQWRGLISSRQENYANPTILRQTIDRLIELGGLSPPQGGDYDTEWPPLSEPSPAEISEEAEKVARAISAFSPGAPDLIVPPWEWRERYLRLPPLPPDPPEGMEGPEPGDLQEMREAMSEMQEQINRLNGGGGGAPPSPGDDDEE